MFVIKKISSNGLLLNDVSKLSDATHRNTKWFTVDSFKILKSKTFSPSFESLKIGDTIDNLKFQKGKDAKDYLISFSLVVASVVDGANHPDVLDKQSSTSSPQKSFIKNGKDYLGKVPCAECGQMVTPTDRHTYGDCIAWKESLKSPSSTTLGQEVKCIGYGHLLSEHSQVGCMHFDNNDKRLAEGYCRCHVKGSSSISRDGDVLNPLFNSNSSLDRYSGCVIIAFNNFSSREVNLAFKMDGKFPMIESAFDLADEIFNEFNKRDKHD